ncbi:hypothetical protein THAOC_06785 [Thalassiosira oceanica]|uniref:Uncharacterized protein n=1 Tax=Thalassiosira oceanica TaxID=159749 RepID=K0TE78_THAOC|nr:hypothetical protein THAOC_06785 [Thalassiosira oceanica]|eukprot:EJK71746.1 hypothetical protein THAOC_06785 [Thalassiosira oceanica]
MRPNIDARSARPKADVGICRRGGRRNSILRTRGRPRLVDGRPEGESTASGVRAPGHPVEVQQATGASRQRASRKERRPVRSPVGDSSPDDGRSPGGEGRRRPPRSPRATGA